jgi:glycosyltransferase involved in cell wall biosynthesis
MRLLAIGHALAPAENQKKYEAMKRLDPSLAVCILTPPDVGTMLGHLRPGRAASLAPEEVRRLPAALTGSHMTYLFEPVALLRLLRRFRPDVIHIEQEPHALVTLETLMVRERIAPPAAVTCFTWDNLLRPRAFPLGAAKLALRRRALGRMAAVVCGNREAERLLRERSGYRGPSFVLPQFGLDPAEFRPGCAAELRRRLGLEGSPVVAYFGRFVPEKGLLVLLDALEWLADLDWKLLLVGAGPLEPELAARAARPPFRGRVVIHPAVPAAEVAEWLRAADIFVLASYAVPHWKEQFGLALAQAMLTGLPSVVSDSGAIPEVAGPGAWVARERNAFSLAAGLEMLLEHPELRQRMGRRARAYAAEHYALDRVARDYLEVFGRAAGQNVIAMPPPDVQPVEEDSAVRGAG